MLTYRLVFKAMITSTALVAASFYFEHKMNLTPCALCYIQRYLMMGVAGVFLLMMITRPRGFGVRLFGFLAFITAGLGAVVSGRHVWLQNLPAGQIPTSCSADLHYMIQSLPFKRVLEQIMTESADCAQVSWKLLGLSMPAWTLGFFVMFALIGFYLMFSHRSR